MMASVSFTLNRPDVSKDGDVILLERIDMQSGPTSLLWLYKNTSWGTIYGTSLEVTEIDENTIAVTINLETVGILIEPKAIYIPSPYN